MAVASPTTACTTPRGGSPASGVTSETRPRRRMASSQRSARARLSGAASFTRSGVVTEGGTFTSERAARTSEMRRSTQSSSARASSAPLHRHRLRPGRADQAELRAVAEAVPQLLGDEGRRRVQQAQHHAEHVLRGAPHLLLVGAVRPGQHGLGEFDEPVAEVAAGEAEAGGGVFVEAERLQRRRRLRHGAVGGVEDPARERQARGGGVEVRARARCRSSRRSGRRSTAW